MSEVTLKQLLEAGVHFGHQARRWNPKMKPFIYTEREGIHVIDLAKTASKLDESMEFVKNLVADGGEIVFVGTKRQAQEIVKREAGRVGAMHLTERWVGGLLTNFESVHKNIKHLNELRDKKAKGELDYLTKKEQLLIDREIIKAEKVIGGIDRLEKIPEAIFVIDAKKEDNAIREARKTGVKVVALADTNADPSVIDYPIPANDDAIKSIDLLTTAIADSYATGKGLFGKKQDKLAKMEVKADA